MIVNKDKHYVNIVKTALLEITKKIFACSSFDKAEIELSGDIYDFFITDYSLLHKDFSVKSFIQAYPKTDIIIIASDPSYSEGSKAIHSGAKEYFDFKMDLKQIVYKIINIYSEKKDNEKLKKELLNNYLLDSKNESYNKMLSFCEKVSNSKANILLTGESGTGKEVAANYIHLCSQRSTNNFVPVNCSAFTETLLESELFGYEQGAFTGAIKSKQGKFEFANLGTLFLDEVGDINLTTQVKLLRVLDSKKVERIGSNIEKLIDFRLISATNKDLVSNVENNKYREDFFYRISTIVIQIPPLRNRHEDMDCLIQYFLIKSQDENNIKINHIDSEAKKFLYNYSYPGNIRELKSIIDRMVVLSVNGTITKDGIPILRISRDDKNKNPNSDLNFNKVLTFKEFKSEWEAKYIKWVLDKTNGNVAEASRQLDISSRQLFNKINEYGIKR